MPRGFILEGPEPQPLPAPATWRLCLGCPTPWEAGLREACKGGGRSWVRAPSCSPKPLGALGRGGGGLNPGIPGPQLGSRTIFKKGVEEARTQGRQLGA